MADLMVPRSLFAIADAQNLVANDSTKVVAHSGNWKKQLPNVPYCTPLLIIKGGIQMIVLKLWGSSRQRK